tara:strand:+ start:2105 stop:2308 length:204 start_codon:yes stop_codon:yes gene_type:complete
MPTQKSISKNNKKFNFAFGEQNNYFVFYKIYDEIKKSGPWSANVAYSLRDELLINYMCAWIIRIDEN